MTVTGGSDQIKCPDGIRDDHAAPRRGLYRHANPFSILVLGALMIAALTGLFGGDKTSTLTAVSPAATLTVDTPRTMRSGLFFETRIAVEAREALSDAVIALPPALWRDQTINTIVPAAESEAFKDGRFRFHYGALAAGDRLEIKIDGQINPPLTIGAEGEVALYDGERPVVSIPLTIRVLP